MRIFKITKTIIFLLGLSVLLALPLSLAQDTDSESSVPPGEAYTVQANDWLSKLAEQYLGDVLAYDLIVDATNAKAAEDDSFARIDNPDVIEVGQQLWIPTLDEMTESDTSDTSEATPAPAPAPAPADEVVGIYKSVLPSAGCCGQDLTLFLNVDNSARLDTDFHNGEPAIVEVGNWAINEAGQVELTLTGQVDRAYDSPAVHLFEQAETGLTRAANPDAPEAILETYYPFPALAMGEAMLPFDKSIASNGFAGIYKAFLPSASCCGQDISLYLNVDGTANLQTDYLNGEAPISESGSWDLNSAGEVVVTLNEGSTTLVLEFREGILRSTAESTAYGSEGVSFYNLSGFVLAMMAQ